MRRPCYDPFSFSILRQRRCEGRVIARCESIGRKVRTPRAGRWVIPRRSDPTPAPQKANRRWLGDGGLSVATAQARVKGWGKGPPRWWRHHRHGKRRPVQGQIGRDARSAPECSAHRLARSRSSGRPLEVRGNPNPREMIIAVRGSELGDSNGYRIRLIGLHICAFLSLVVKFFHDCRESPCDRGKDMDFLCRSVPLTLR